ncbi:serine/threonine-protein phosphatase 4 regulatory subunit 1-like isoform X1 [Dreissena polymorpha]|uniref:serine/threonine-protein phosphatase 4 regulatory subunit 1-like isoform X1 n=1 Tax=Dreissena polymorpha TaxID=45954 RepID=UPI0022643BC5|nr:serine/threonine-protein phosphatase 4 regulatory subunit 1-like isoform X1 [Dreissena polymorpha]
MADINLYHGEGDDNADDGYGLEDNLDCEEPFSVDDNLSALQKLEKYMESDNVYTRQMVAKGLLDTLHSVDTEQTRAVLTAMVKLSEDSDPIVRSELMDQVPHIALYCHKNGDLIHNAVEEYILPMVVRYLDDANNQVRKTSQAALLVLLEQDLVTKELVESLVVHVILELAGVDSLDEYRTEAVALMSKMAPLLGKEMTERVFLDRFCEMCTDPLFHVRKVCAANFGDFCSVVSQESTEKKLLPKFYYLCEDGVWGVRKACAECFMTVSCTCSHDVRKTELSALFVSLLCDQSRWVRMAAFQQLGPFISTFADADCTGLYMQEDGSLVFKPSYAMKKRQKEEEEDSVVSEIVDCDSKTLPDVIPTNMLEQNQSAVCDITANVMMVDMDTSADNDSLEDKKKKVGTESEWRDFGSSPGLVQVNTDKSVEEIRAEHYVGQNIEKDKIVETLSDEKTIESNVVEPVQDIVDTQTSTGHNSNNNLTEEHIGDVHTIGTNSGAQDDSSDIVKSLNDAKHKVESVQDQSEHQEVAVNVENSSNFNSFQFWRTPLPVVELDLDLLQDSSTEPEMFRDPFEDNRPHTDQCAAFANTLEDLSICDNLPNTVIDDQYRMSRESLGSNEVDISDIEPITPIDDTEETTMRVINGVVQDLSDINLGHIDSKLLLSLLPLADLSGGVSNMMYMDHDFSSLSPSGLHGNLPDDATLAQQQDIIPQSLLENYLGMTEPSRAQTVDTDITKYCAYNLPAVAYTLGRENWHCIRNLYETLAADMQWKVRRTLAFSIHELAVILGEEITHRDLVPVFDGFLKDLDEVRIGILRHLADFLKFLHPNVRRQYLIKVQDFMNVDNSRNWRFRQELAEQLALIAELYSATEISDHLLPMAIALAEDKVAEVRLDAYHLISVMIKRMRDSGDEKLVQYLINQLIQKFALNSNWARRQIYTLLCSSVVREESLSPQEFARDMLPSLLDLVKDTVPNVRITLAKTLYSYINNEKYSGCEGHSSVSEVEEVMSQLRLDSDRDVRFYCSPEAYQETTAYSDDTNSLNEYQVDFRLADQLSQWYSGGM